MLVLAVDPGIRGCGVAAFRDGRLYGAAYVASSQQHDAADYAACVAMARAVQHFCMPWAPHGFDEVVIEYPQVYTPGKQKGDPNDLPPLVGVGAAICMCYTRAKHVTYLPYQWKQQVPKEVMAHRIEAKLTAEERACVWLPTAAGLQHNLWDAVGVALHHIGRLDRHRVIAR